MRLKALAFTLVILIALPFTIGQMAMASDIDVAIQYLEGLREQANRRTTATVYIDDVTVGVMGMDSGRLVVGAMLGSLGAGEVTDWAFIQMYELLYRELMSGVLTLQLEFQRRLGGDSMDLTNITEMVGIMDGEPVIRGTMYRRDPDILRLAPPETYAKIFVQFPLDKVHHLLSKTGDDELDIVLDLNGKRELVSIHTGLPNWASDVQEWVRLFQLETGLGSGNYDDLSKYRQ